MAPKDTLRHIQATLATSPRRAIQPSLPKSLSTSPVGGGAVVVVSRQFLAMYTIEKETLSTGNLLALRHQTCLCLFERSGGMDG